MGRFAMPGAGAAERCDRLRPMQPDAGGLNGLARIGARCRLLHRLPGDAQAFPRVCFTLSHSLARPSWCAGSR